MKRPSRIAGWNSWLKRRFSSKTVSKAVHFGHDVAGRDVESSSLQLLDGRLRKGPHLIRWEVFFGVFPGVSGPHKGPDPERIAGPHPGRESGGSGRCPDADEAGPRIR